MPCPCPESSSRQHTPVATLCGRRAHPFEFSANAWHDSLLALKNFALSVLTVGVYSAWGKVQRQRYLASHTWLDGYSFGGCVQPWEILRSRFVFVELLFVLLMNVVGGPMIAAFGRAILLVQVGVMFLLVCPLWSRQVLYRGGQISFVDNPVRDWIRGLPFLSTGVLGSDGVHALTLDGEKKRGCEGVVWRDRLFLAASDRASAS